MQIGDGKILVVDGMGSIRSSIFDSSLAQIAYKSGWKGVIINGCVRNANAIKKAQLGVKAIGTHPSKGASSRGNRESMISFAGVQFISGHYLYADEVSSIHF